MIVLLVNIWWLWKYAEGVGVVTRGQFSNVAAFVLLLLVSIIGIPVVQSQFNKVAAA